MRTVMAGLIGIVVFVISSVVLLLLSAFTFRMLLGVSTYRSSGTYIGVWVFGILGGVTLSGVSVWLFARSGEVIPRSAEHWSPDELRVLSLLLLVAGGLLVVVGAVSAAASVVAALDDRAFTVSLGGLVLGLGAGLLIVGLLLTRADRPGGLVIATAVLLPTLTGYVAGGLSDLALR